MPEADWILRVVTLGPPVVLVLALVSILGTSAAGKLEIRQTLVLSGIAAAFFIMWLIALPQLNKRKVYIVTTVSPASMTSEYSLKPVRYRIFTPEPMDLSNVDFDFPDGREPVKMEFDLDALVRSYEDNLKTIIRVARNDPKCFDKATQGVAYSKVAASIQKECPTSRIPESRVYE
jgi:hypothetical protein